MESAAKKPKKKVTELNWKCPSKFVKGKKWILQANALLDFPENANPLLIFGKTMNLKKHIDQTNLYATQNRREFAANPEEMQGFLGINYIISISKLPN